MALKGVQTVVIDRGMDKFEAQLEKAEGSFTDIGIFGGMARIDGDLTSIALYALINELGAENIPERSFIRSVVDENRVRYNKFITDGLDGIILGRKTVEQVLNELGIIVKGDIKRKITELKEPPNAPSTIRAKRGSTNPLIDTGAMRNAVEYKVTVSK